MNPQEAEEYLENWIAGDKKLCVPDLLFAMRLVSAQNKSFAKQIIWSIPRYIEQEERDWPIDVDPLVRAYVEREENRADETLVLILQKAREYKKKIPYRGNPTTWIIEQGLLSIIYSITGRYE